MIDLSSDGKAMMKLVEAGVCGCIEITQFS